jgi:hypothetical protein
MPAAAAAADMDELLVLPGGLESRYWQGESVQQQLVSVDLTCILFGVATNTGTSPAPTKGKHTRARAWRTAPHAPPHSPAPHPPPHPAVGALLPYNKYHRLANAVSAALQLAQLAWIRTRRESYLRRRFWVAVLHRLRWLIKALVIVALLDQADTQHVLEGSVWRRRPGSWVAFWTVVGMSTLPGLLSRCARCSPACRAAEAQQPAPAGAPPPSQAAVPRPTCPPRPALPPAAASTTRSRSGTRSPSQPSPSG